MRYSGKTNDTDEYLKKLPSSKKKNIYPSRFCRKVFQTEHFYSYIIPLYHKKSKSTPLFLNSSALHNLKSRKLIFKKWHFLTLRNRYFRHPFINIWIKNNYPTIAQNRLTSCYFYLLYIGRNEPSIPNNLSASTVATVPRTNSQPLVKTIVNLVCRFVYI